MFLSTFNITFSPDDCTQSLAIRLAVETNITVRRVQPRFSLILLQGKYLHLEVRKSLSFRLHSHTYPTPDSSLVYIEPEPILLKFPLLCIFLIESLHSSYNYKAVHMNIVTLQV